MPVCLATDMFLPPRWLFIIARQFEEEPEQQRSVPSIRVITAAAAAVSASLPLRLQRQRQISRNWHLLMLEILRSHLFLSLPLHSRLTSGGLATVPRPLNP